MKKSSSHIVEIVPWSLEKKYLKQNSLGVNDLRIMEYHRTEVVIRWIDEPLSVIGTEVVLTGINEQTRESYTF